MTRRSAASSSDPVARLAIRRLVARVTRLEQRLGRRQELAGRCYLCGDPAVTGSRFCHAHQWAEGGDDG